MSHARLECLPVEIIYTVFDCLSVHHILQAFLNMNSRFNQLLSAYQGYEFDFKSISRTQFDLAWKHIKPIQVVSITVSDLDDTPGQSELFFSRFQITDFKRLRMLKLINIKSIQTEDLYQLFRNFNRFRQLSIETHDGNPLLCMATQVKIDTIKNLLASAQSFHLCFNIPACLPFLRCLTVSQISIKELESICTLALLLRSLKIENLILNANHDLLLRLHQLRRLVLYCKNTPVSMNQMEQLLSNLPKLRYFEISAKGSLDLTNGYLWERLTHQLITFNFNFWVEIHGIEDTLDLFRTSFWIERKKWFVAATNKRLFSVPHFSKKIADAFFLLPWNTTIPNTTLLLNEVNHFILNHASTLHQNYFRYVKTFEIQNTDAIKSLSNWIDLNRVENFILSSSINFSTVLPLMKSMSSLQQFSINTELKTFLDQTQNLSFKQIQVLEINRSIVDEDFYVIEQLVRVFPNIEILRVNSIQWQSGIARLLDKFENLFSASFRLQNSPTSQTDANISSFIRDEIQHEKYEEFHYSHRINSNTNQYQEEYYNFWVKKQVCFVFL